MNWVRTNATPRVDGNKNNGFLVICKKQKNKIKIYLIRNIYMKYRFLPYLEINNQII